MERFIELIAEVLEVDPSEISMETDFRRECEFDSLKGFSMICMIEDEYDVQVQLEQFLASHTIGDLFRLTTDED